MTTTDPTEDTGSTMTIGSLALQTAQGQIGQAEEPPGSNKGPMVNEYLKATGLNPGYAWCQAFVYWCYNEAAKKLGRTNPVVKTAGVYDCWNKTQNKSNAPATKMLKALLIKQTLLPQPGDQFILTFGRAAGHTGIIEKAERTANDVVLHTIEGNSNDNGSREGYEVVRRIRRLSDKALQGFIRYA